MCGIAGFVGIGERSDLAAMTKAVAHRGPDGEGAYIDSEARVFLGHRRLAIVDIAGGAQPMWNAEGAICVVQNGEIYNHLELRRELQAKGYRFLTDHADTEVLVHGYAEWGEDLPRRLNGMFAFCIYDKPRKRLFLARDRFGEKPLYIARQGDLFAFASELHAITAHSKFHAKLRARSLQKVLAYGFLPAPNAIFEDCEKLPGGAWMSLDLANRRGSDEALLAIQSRNRAVLARPGRRRLGRGIARPHRRSDAPAAACRTCRWAFSSRADWIRALCWRRRPRCCRRKISKPSRSGSRSPRSTNPNTPAKSRPISASTMKPTGWKSTPPAISPNRCCRGSTSRSATPRSCRPICSPASPASV